VSVLLAGAAALLVAIGTYLVLQRTLSRIIIGIGLLGHGANIVLVTSGRGGRPPLVGTADAARFGDPLPQAFVLTAIVITFGVSALLLALAYRSFVLSAGDEVTDDVEDRFIARSRRMDDDERDAAATDDDLP
jgi:multicomponent Na+:H+ antiporter subunit C